MGKHTFISRKATGLISSVLEDVDCCGSAVICGFRASQELIILIQVCSWQVFASRVCSELCPSWNPQGMELSGGVWLLLFGGCVLCCPRELWGSVWSSGRWALLFPVSPGAVGAAVIESSITLGQCSWLQPRGRWMCPAPLGGGQLQFKLGGWSSPGCRRIW